MTSDGQSQLRFDIYEKVTVHYDQPGIDTLLSLDLVPEVQIDELGDAVRLSGVLRLRGTYLKEGETREQITLEDELNGEKIEYVIPVEITMPAERVKNIEQICAQIESFDYDILSSRQLAIQAVLLIDGLHLEKAANDMHASFSAGEQWAETIQEEPQLSVQNVSDDDERAVESHQSQVPWQEERAAMGQEERTVEDAADQASEAYARSTEYDDRAPREWARDRTGEGEDPTHQVGTRAGGEKVSDKPAPGSAGTEESTRARTGDGHASAKKRAVERKGDDEADLHDDLRGGEQDEAERSASPTEEESVTKRATDSTPKGGTKITFQKKDEKTSPVTGTQKKQSSAGETVHSFDGMGGSHPEGAGIEEPIGHDGQASEEFAFRSGNTYGSKFDRQAYDGMTFSDNYDGRSYGDNAYDSHDDGHPYGGNYSDVHKPSGAGEEQATDTGGRDEDSHSQAIEWMKKKLGGEDDRFHQVKIVIVQQEDTLESIADRYNLSSVELLQVNRLQSGELQAGEIVYIPQKKA